MTRDVRDFPSHVLEELLDADKVKRIDGLHPLLRDRIEQSSVRVF